MLQIELQSRPSETYICLCYSCFVGMAASSIPLTQLEDITECPICSEIFVDTRVLPCIHTYCLRCITSLGGDKTPGDKIPCPLCRKEFAIPEGGISKLPKNYFVEKLLEAKSLANILRYEDSLCEVCADDEEMSKSKEKRDRKAIVYCVDCRKNMCKQCYGCHQQFKLPGAHKLFERNETPLPEDDLLLKFPETPCDNHPDKHQEIYCFQCEAVVCIMCYLKGHNSHKCTDVKDVADDLATRMTANAEGIRTKIGDCKSMLKKIEEEERILADEVKETEKIVNEKADNLKGLIDQHREKVLIKLSTAKAHQFKENENVKEELERQMVVMESFLRYTGELKEKGTPCDVVKTAGELCVKGAELVKFDVEVDLPVDYTSTEVKFEATFSVDDIERIFGDVDITVGVKGTQLMSRRLKHNRYSMHFSFLRATAYMLSAHMLSQFRPSVCLSVCPSPSVRLIVRHTGGSVKNS